MSTLENAQETIFCDRADPATAALHSAMCSQNPDQPLHMSRVRCHSQIADSIMLCCYAIFCELVSPPFSSSSASSGCRWMISFFRRKFPLITHVPPSKLSLFISRMTMAATWSVKKNPIFSASLLDYFDSSFPAAAAQKTTNEIWAHIGSLIWKIRVFHFSGFTFSILFSRPFRSGV